MTYSAEGFLEKNSDRLEVGAALAPGLCQCLLRSATRLSLSLCAGAGADAHTSKLCVTF